MKFLKDNRILEISESNPEEAKEILEYINIVAKESTNLLIDESGLEFTEAQEKKYLEQCQKSVNNKIFTGKVNGVIVSIGSIDGINRNRVKHNVNLGISVLKEYWNLGVATQMTNHIINYCRLTPGIKNVALEVKNDNLNAIKLYKKLGFKEIGRYSNKFKVGDLFFDSIIMELLL